MTPQLRFPQFTDEWQVKKLSDLVEIFDGTHQTPTYIKSGIPFYSVENVTADNFLNTKYVAEKVLLKEKNKPEKGDILMTRIGDIGTVRYVDWDARASFYVSLALLKQSKHVNNHYLVQYIKTSMFQRELWKRTIHVAFPRKINLGEIGKSLVKVPLVLEQEKIAEFLAAVDERIKKQNQKVELLKKYKKSIIQKIFSQKINFIDEVGNLYPGWQQKKLDEVLIKSSQKNKNSQYSIVQSVSNSKGFINQTDLFKDHVVASKDLSNYYIIERGMFAYNPSRIDVGSLAYKSDNVTSVVSPLYVCFKTNTLFLNDKYLMAWFKSEQFIKQMNSLFEGSVRNTLSYDSLKCMKIKLPNIDEQQKIANFLKTLDDKIQTEETRFTTAKRWKNGLLQRMFV